MFRRLRTRLILSLAIVCVLYCGGGMIALGGTNPTSNVPSTLYWRYNGANYSEQLLRGDYYNTADTGWCGGHTTEEGNKYNHVHVTSSFNYSTDQHAGDVTAAMVDAYWDWYYSGYTQSGSVDQSSNCHGYSTGHGTWVDGMSVILADEYVSDNSLDAVIRANGSHSQKLTELWDMGGGCIMVQTTKEKNRDSAIYELEVLGPLFQGELTSDGYKLD